MNALSASLITGQFLKDNNFSLPAFDQANVESEKMRKTLQSFFETSPFSPDVDLVVFGSLSRNECTPGSDVDWTLLLDGQANPGHLNVANSIRNKILEKLKQPGTSGTFGNTTISHDIIHYIGGERDTNQNITRRILLLLESERINFEKNEILGGYAYDRVINGILSQYFDHDSGLRRIIKPSIPRFLLNDIIRSGEPCA